jgi:hypothetical protein
MKIRKKLPYISRKKKLKKTLKKFCGLKKRTYLYIIKLTNHLKKQKMKKSDVLIIAVGSLLFVGLVALASYLVISNTVASNIGVIM